MSKRRINTITISLLFLLFIPLTNSCKAYKVLHALKSGTISNENFNETIPFNYEGHIVIELKINGLTKNFMLDTGAGINLISKKLSEELQLSSDFKYEAGDRINSAKSEWVKIDTIDIAGIRIADSYAVVQDLTINSAIYCLNIDGIIGNNVLKKMNLKIDYLNKNITMYSGEKEIKYDYEFPIEISTINTPKLNFKINQKEFNGTLDTGFPYEIMMNKAPLDSTSKQYSFIYGDVHKRLYGVAADTLKLFKNKTLQIGTFNPKEVKIIGSSITSEKEILIGNKMFDDYIVYIDNTQKKIFLKKQNTPHNDSLSYRFGLGLVDSKVVVSALIKGSELIDVPIGSQVISINGINLKDISFDDYCTINNSLQNITVPIAIEVMVNDSIKKYQVTKHHSII